MVSADLETHAAIVLVRDPHEAAQLDRVLRELHTDDVAGSFRIVTPDVRGLDFFAADTHRAADLDKWWGNSVPRHATPVYFLYHESGLAGWLGGLDGQFYVSIPSPAIANEYISLSNVTAFVSDGGIVGFADQLLRDVDRQVVTLQLRVPVADVEEDRGSEQLFRPTKTRRLHQSRSSFRRARLGSDELGALDETAADKSEKPASGENTDEIIGLLATTLTRLEQLRAGG